MATTRTASFSLQRTYLHGMICATKSDCFPNQT